MVYAILLARRTRLNSHCRVMRLSLAGLVLTTVVFMLPRLVDLTGIVSAGSGRGILMWLHHGLGLAVVGLWVFFNLAVSGRIKVGFRLRGLMWAAVALWLAVLIMGVLMYAQYWPWPWQ